MDGVTHINVYSKGATKLGVALSNFAHTPIELPDDGRFECIEGYWYWLSTKDDALRRLIGWHAKAYGRKIRAPEQATRSNEFKQAIVRALHAKMQQHPYLKLWIQATELPLLHYYVYSGAAHDHTLEAKFMLDVFDGYRKGLP